MWGKLIALCKVSCLFRKIFLGPRIIIINTARYPKSHKFRTGFPRMRVDDATGSVCDKIERHFKARFVNAYFDETIVLLQVSHICPLI